MSSYSRGLMVLGRRGGWAKEIWSIWSTFLLRLFNQTSVEACTELDVNIKDDILICGVSTTLIYFIT